MLLSPLWAPYRPTLLRRRSSTSEFARYNASRRGLASELRATRRRGPFPRRLRCLPPGVAAPLAPFALPDHPNRSIPSSCRLPHPPLRPRPCAFRLQAGGNTQPQQAAAERRGRCSDHHEWQVEARESDRGGVRSPGLGGCIPPSLPPDTNSSRSISGSSLPDWDKLPPGLLLLLLRQAASSRPRLIASPSFAPVPSLLTLLPP